MKVVEGGGGGSDCDWGKRREKRGGGCVCVNGSFSPPLFMSQVPRFAKKVLVVELFAW